MIAWLMSLAMLVVALIPAGMMPGKNDKSLYSVVLCTAQGFRTVYLDANGEAQPDGQSLPQDPDHQDHASTHPCVFATLHAAPVQSDFSLAVPTVGRTLHLVLEVPSALIRPLAFLPLGARAPPTLS